MARDIALRRVWLASVAGLTLAILGSPCLTARAFAGPRMETIAFLGDSITDGETYILLVRQAFADARRPGPTLINAGVGGDDAHAMLGRLARDVLPYHPSQVFLSCGVNDKVAVDEFSTSVSNIVDELLRRGISVTLMTPSIPGDNQPSMKERRDGYIRAIRDVARKRCLKLAEVNELMKRERARGIAQIGDDGVHPNFAGSRTLARAVLDSIGENTLPVPATLSPPVMPGILRLWKVRPVPAGARPITRHEAMSVSPNDWQSLSLPQPPTPGVGLSAPNGLWWREQERRRGFALDLSRFASKGERFQAVAYLDEPVARHVTFNTGGNLETAWLNGERIYLSSGWTGWHVGKERIPALLRAGRNTIVIETKADFFLSVTTTSQN